MSTVFMRLPLVLSARPSRPRLIQEFPCSWGRNHSAACCERPLTDFDTNESLALCRLWGFTFNKKTSNSEADKAIASHWELASESPD